MSTSNKRGSAGVTCSLCKAVMKAGQHTISCMHCGISIHLTCQHKLFKDAGYQALKGLENLAEFLQFSALAYRCKACLDKHATVSQDGATVPMVKTQDIIAMKESITTLDTKIQSLSNTIAQLGALGHVLVAADGQFTQPPTYATVASANIVKSAVSEAIREQQKANVDKSSVVFYGFPEEGDDNTQLRDMIDYLGCRCDVTRHSRIGHPHQSKSARPIKIEFKSFNDASVVLSKAKHLRDDAYYTGVYINKWLSDIDMKSIKQLRQQCGTLNQGQASVNGRKKFIVISGKIMERDSSGRLQVYSIAKDKEDAKKSSNTVASPTESTSQASSNPKAADQQTKNSTVGSHVTP